MTNVIIGIISLWQTGVLGFNCTWYNLVALSCGSDWWFENSSVLNTIPLYTNDSNVLYPKLRIKCDWGFGLLLLVLVERRTFLLKKRFSCCIKSEVCFIPMIHQCVVSVVGKSFANCFINCNLFDGLERQGVEKICSILIFKFFMVELRLSVCQCWWCSSSLSIIYLCERVM